MKLRIIPARPIMALMAVAAAALFAFLAWQAYASAGGPAQRLMLVTPKAGEAAALAASARGFDIDAIEKLCESQFLVTYETRSKTNARAGQLRAAKQVNIVGTNSCYQDLMGYSMADGGFFTKSAWDAKERQVVLNEAAAFALFGGVHVSRQPSAGAVDEAERAGEAADEPANEPADEPTDEPANEPADDPSEETRAEPVPPAFMFGGRFRGSANVGDTVPPVSIGLAGAIEIDGEYWTVVGVMFDGSDESNAYVPSSITGGSPVTLAALLGSGAMTASRAKSELKAFGVNESAYDFIPMPDVWSAFNERADVALSTAAAAVGIFLVFEAIFWAICAFRARRDEEEAATLHVGAPAYPGAQAYLGAQAYPGAPTYPGDYAYPGAQAKLGAPAYLGAQAYNSTQYRYSPWGVAGVCIVVPALCAAVLFLAQRAVPSFLSWQGIYALADAKPALQFVGFLAPVQSAQSMGFSALWAFIGLVAATLAAAIASSAPPKQSP